MAEEVLPALEISLSRDEASDYHWKLTIEESDHTGTRKLGYRASGTSGVDVDPTFPLLVRDADRNVWTTMPQSHRPDVRERIVSIVRDALHLLDSVKK